MTNIFQLRQNVIPMTIALVHQIHANLTSVIADQRQNAQKDPIHVQPADANVATMKNVRIH